MSNCKTHSYRYPQDYLKIFVVVTLLWLCLYHTLSRLFYRFIKTISKIIFIYFLIDYRQSSELQEILQVLLSMSIKGKSSLNLPAQGMEPMFSAQNPMLLPIESSPSILIIELLSDHITQHS